MSIFQSLEEGKVGLIGGVNLDGRRAGRGENLRCCRAQGKDVCGMGSSLMSKDILKRTSVGGSLTTINGVRGEILF